ncbi:DUF3037 domain-containing protein [Galbibacter sp.]|uniref:DUF3037 domain-containing protein n=1 Tax=Galbibacter sp. TaxID=2918471 RepID=UPI003A8F4D3E
MKGKHLYEYAVIRVVPRVEREEFTNVGIILFCKQQKYLAVKYHIPVEKLKLVCTELDLDDVEMHLQSFEKISNAGKDGGRIAAMDVASRFRWLTAVRSSSIQTSRPHTGYSENLEVTLNALFEDLVL